MVTFVLVIIVGALFSLGDIVARKWSENPASLPWFLFMMLVGTGAYTTFASLVRYAEFSKAAIWVSLALTTFSCLYGILMLGDPLTGTKIAAFLLALTAAYLSVL